MLSAAGAQLIGQLRTAVVALVVILVAAVVAELLEPLKAFDRWTREQQNELTAVTLTLTAAGWCVFMGAIIYHVVRARQATGTAAFAEERSFREIKSAVRAGQRFAPRWRRVFVVAVGALMMACGMFGFFIVAGPPVIKLILMTVCGYALIRTVWGFWRA